MAPVVKLPTAPPTSPPPEEEDNEGGIDIVLDWSLLRTGPPEVTDVYPDLPHPVP